LSLLTDWDLDAAFLTSSDPYLKLKVDAEPNKDGLLSSKISLTDLQEEEENANNNKYITKIFQPKQKNKLKTWDVNSSVQKSWQDKLGEAFNKLTIWGNQQLFQNNEGVFPTKTPLDDAEFRQYLDDEGRVVRGEGLRMRIYHGGIDPSLRKVVWRILLNVFPENLTGEQRLEYIKNKTSEYELLRHKWQSKADDDEVKILSNMVWKDALRTDRNHKFYEGPDDNPNTISLLNILTTYALSHPKVSYCQGMSDVVSPILVVMDNEAQAYICFCAIMRRLKYNFSTDGIALSTKLRHLAMLVERFDPEFYNYLVSVDAGNMFFCYRWLLLEMKREFSFEDAIVMLEVMWSSLPPDPPLKDLSLEEDPHEEEVLVQVKPPTPTKTSPKKQKRIRRKKPARKTDDEEKSPSRDSFNALKCEFNSLLGNHGDSLSDISSAESTAADGETLSMSDVIDYKMLRKTSASPLLPTSGHKWKGIPPPQELGFGHPFLLFVAMALLLEEREALLGESPGEGWGYEEVAMHFDGLVRRNNPKKVLSRAISNFADYLRCHRGDQGCHGDVGTTS